MLSKEDIDAIVEAYASAADRARRCGFDGVELHMAHAYTLSSFLSRRNPRKDEYGGATLETRLGLPIRVLRKVRERVGDDFPIGVRFLGEECIKDGYTTLDAAKIAVRLAREGVDYISLSAGGKFEDAIKKEGEPLYPYTGYSGDRCMPSSAYPDGANLYIAEAVKRALVSEKLETPVVAVGKIGTRDLAEDILQKGRADLVGMARALLADPDIPKKWRRDEEHKVVRCLYGNVCKQLDENFRRVDCTLWPKKRGQAPESDDTIPPEWPNPDLRAEVKDGRVVLRWNPATDNEAIYGYEVMRARGDGILLHAASVRGVSQRWEDAGVLAGETYRYSVRPYDLAGNRGPMSATISVAVARDDHGA
jgi:hypothetical protein